MYKVAILILSLIAGAVAKPAIVAPVAYTAPAAAVLAAPAPVVTASSSQVFSRNYNGFASAPIVAAAPVAVAPAYASPYTGAYSAPVIAAAPYGAYTAGAPATYFL